MSSCLNTVDNGYCEKKLVANDPWVECAPRPSVSHALADNWQSDPMNPAVCWRNKTAQEIDDEAEVEATAELESLKALKAVILLACEKAGEDITDPAVRQAAFQQAKQIYKAL